MSENSKKILVYIIIGVFFALLPYWAFGKNLSQLNEEKQQLQSENSVLYDEIEERSAFIETYSNLEEELAKFNTSTALPSDIIELLVNISITNGLTLNTVTQTKEEFPDTDLEKFTTEAVFTSESVISDLIINSTQNSETYTTVRLLESSLREDGLYTTKVVIETLL